MAASQKQIAEKVGVSITLVSRVLSGKAAEIGIAQDTIDRVMRTAVELGYVPSAAALSLKGKATRTIGVAVYDFNDPFFGSLIKEIQVQAHEYDYSLVLAGFLNRLPDSQDLQSLHKHAIDGLIVLGSDIDARWLKDFQQLPVARIGHGNDRERSVRISVDETKAAALLVEHLTARGCSSMMCIAGSLTAHTLRCEALEAAAKTAGMPFEAVVEKEKDAFQAGLLATRKLLGTGYHADAFACTTDQVAMGALHALADAGIDVPGQVAVSGFDDIPAAEQFIPPLTTLHQPIAEMVRAAFLNVIEPSDPGCFAFEGSLVVRQTA